MANKKGAKENILAGATQATGSAAGKVSPAGATRDAGSAPKAKKKGKLIKKKTSRLPRKQKKALQKAAAKQS
jgi:hypothetical protein